MINWQPIFDFNLSLEESYLVSDGKYVDIAKYADYSSDPSEPDPRWYLPEISPLDEDDISYVAVINAPGAIK